MTAEEAAAFREVVGQVNGDYQRLARLATNDELTSTERQVIDKATSVITTDLTFAAATDGHESRASALGRGGYEIAQQVYQEAVVNGENFGGGGLRGGGFGGGQGGVGNFNGPGGARGGSRRRSRRTCQHNDCSRGERAAVAALYAIWHPTRKLWMKHMPKPW